MEFSDQEPLPDIVYLVLHDRGPDAGQEVHKELAMFIGCFSSEETAAAVIDRLKTQPGFRDWPDAFVVERRELDVAYFAEGFRPG